VVEYDDQLDQTTVANHLVYNAFGGITSETNSAVDHIFGYTSRERDEESDLYYYRARYYDPALGRMVAEDPTGFAAADTNLTRYVGNSPTNMFDPNGLDKVVAQRFAGPPPLIGKICYLDEGGLFTSDSRYPAGKRAMHVVQVGSKKLFYQDLELAAKNDEIDSQTDFDTFVDKANRRFLFYGQLQAVVYKLSQEARTYYGRRDAYRGLTVKTMVDVIGREFFGSSGFGTGLDQGNASFGSKCLDFGFGVATNENFLKMADLGDFVISPGTAGPSSQVIGKFHTYDVRGFFKRTHDVTYHYPEWRSRLQEGVLRTDLPNWIAQAGRVFDWLQAGQAGRLVIESAGGSDPQSALTGLQGVIGIVGAFRAPGIAQYFDFLGESIGSMVSAARAIEMRLAEMNASRLSRSGAFLAETMGSATTPLSRAWFRAKAPMLTVGDRLPLQ